VRADGGHDHDHRRGDPGRDRVAGPAQQHDRQGANADQYRECPGVEGQEGQVDQAKGEADEGGGHPADGGGHALAVAVAQDEDSVLTALALSVAGRQDLTYMSLSF
jgi:hypothetical protein